MKAQDAMPIIAAKKVVQKWYGFQKRDNHAGHIIGFAQLSDEDGVYFPGLTVEIEIKVHAVSPQCLFQFTLRQKFGKIKEVVYQLEVAPHNKRSHNSLTPIYGPHEHIGNDDPVAVQENGVNCENWNGCLDWFIQRTNISGLIVEQPC